MIEVCKISKSYGEVRALKNISFRVEDGELFGLIGPDGAGKTSLFRILTTLQLADSGTANVTGLNVINDYREIRNISGYMPQRFSLYQDLSVQENLQFFASVFGTRVEENYDLIRDIYDQLAPFKNRRAGALSGGMKQKLALSCALIHKPKVLLLDEPTTGVDPVSRKEFWEMLKSLKGSGISILVSTPFMDEAAKCERVALINKGEILAIDTPNGIRKSFADALYAVRSSEGMYKLLGDLKDYENTHTAYAFGESVHYTDKRREANVEKQLRDYLTEKGHAKAEIEPIEAGVEDSFMEYMTKSETA